MNHFSKSEQDDWLTVYLKYLLFVFNFFFWVGGAAILAVGTWTLVEKSGYLSVLASSTFVTSAYILIFAGALVMITGFLGFCAVLREQKSCLSTHPLVRFMEHHREFLEKRRNSDSLLHLQELPSDSYSEDSFLLTVTGRHHPLYESIS